MKHSISLGLAVGVLATVLVAQSTSDTPLKNFTMPMFNEAGRRIWDLRAAAVQVLSEKADRFELTAVHVRMLAGDEARTLEGELFAPTAIVDQTTQTITGRGQLHVIRGGVELFGDDWTYRADTKSIVIERNVVVTFASDLGNILQ